MTNKTTPIHVTNVVNGENVTSSNPLPITIIGGSANIPANKVTDTYGFQAKSVDATYTYYFFEDGDGAWYVLRKHNTTNVYDYTKGTGGYTSVYVDSTSGPSGSPTWGTYDETFDNLGVGAFNFDGNGYLEVTQPNVEHTNTHTGNIELRTYQENHICTQNTTTTPLDANATFTGDWQDCLNYAEVNVSIVADKNSATNGLVFQWSADGVTIGDTDVYSYYTANGGTNYTPNPAFRYVRMVYTNGSQAQTSFSLQTILRRQMTGGSFHRIDSTLRDDQDGRLQLVVPKLRTAQNNYISQAATSAGNAKVSIEEIEASVDIARSSIQTDGTQISKAYLVDEDGVQSQMLGDNVFSGSPVTIEAEHHEIHCGDSLTVTHSVDLGNGATRDILIKTPVSASRQYHFYIEVVSESETDYKLYEDTTVSNDGTTLNARNRNRHTPVVSESEVSFFHTPTVTGVGTLLEEEHWGSGRGVGGTSRGQNEWVFKNNANYMIRINNATVNANYIAIKINYYVHPGV